MSDFISGEELQQRMDGVAVNESLLDKIIDLNAKLNFTVNKDSQEDKYGNIFITGVQRSGTTLAYQVLAKHTDLGYVNNLIARFWENPQYGIFLSKSLGLEKEIVFDSEQGSTKHISNVHEFGYFWASLLQHKSSPRLGENSQTPIDWELIKIKLLSINHAFNSSCAHKNTLFGHYADLIGETIKTPLFVYLERDPIETAYSTLRSRIKRYGDIKSWWSMKPYEYDQINNLSPHEQVAAQVFYLEADIKKKAAMIDDGNKIILPYRELCEDPNVFLKKVKEKLEDLGQTINISPVKGEFKFSTVNPNDSDVEILQGYIDKYY